MQDKFQFVLTPVKLNATYYNNQNYVFSSVCAKPTILYYSLAMVRVGVNIFFNLV